MDAVTSAISTADLLKVAAAALVPSMATVLGTVWALSSKITRLESKQEEHKARLDEHKVMIEKQENDTDAFIEEQRNRWSDLNFTLGQIEVKLGPHRRPKS